MISKHLCYFSIFIHLTNTIDFYPHMYVKIMQQQNPNTIFDVIFKFIRLRDILILAVMSNIIYYNLNIVVIEKFELPKPISKFYRDENTVQQRRVEEKVLFPMPPKNPEIIEIPTKKPQYYTFPNKYFNYETKTKIIYHVNNDARTNGKKGITHNEQYFQKRKYFSNLLILSF